MQVIELPLISLIEATWNPNEQETAMMARLTESISRYGLVQNLVVRPLADGNYEVLSGNQRIQVLRDQGHENAPCMIVELDDIRAKMLAQALNRIHGEDDLGLRAELFRQVLDKLPQPEVLSLLPETAESLAVLCSLGEEDMAGYLQSWQQAQEARLKHLQFQLTTAQMEVVEEVMARLMLRAKASQGDSPNARGTALYLLCIGYLDQEESSV